MVIANALRLRRISLYEGKHCRDNGIPIMQRQ